MDRNSKNYTERRGTFIVLTIAIIVILLLVISGIIVAFTVEHQTANIILYVLIASVIFVGLFSFFFMQWQKQRTENKRAATAHRWTRHPDQVDRAQKFEPTAPPLSSRTSWAYTPDRYSQRSTLLASK